LSLIVLAKVSDSNKFLVERIAEDIWLENGQAYSFMDIFVEAQLDSTSIKAIKLGVMGQVSMVFDTTEFFVRIADKWGQSVATNQYKFGVTKGAQSQELLIMSIDGMETEISRQKCNFYFESLKSRTTGNVGSAIEVTFNPSIEPGTRRAVKLCLALSNFSRKEGSLSEVDFYPYCSAGIGGVNFFEKYGMFTKNLIYVKEYYIQAIPPPDYDYDRVRSTKTRSEDYCYCDTCDKFCPYVAGLIKGISIRKDRRLFLRYKAVNLKSWTDNFIVHLFYFRKLTIGKGVVERLKILGLSTEEQDILYLLIKADRPLSVNDIYKELKNQIGLVTLYGKVANLEKKEFVAALSQKTGLRGKPAFLYTVTEKGKQIIQP
jgi:hypothetical protein